MPVGGNSRALHRAIDDAVHLGIGEEACGGNRIPTMLSDVSEVSFR